ncbi:FecR domain-containing protein [Brevundimonas sp.]|uniref:FecR family protein n=1 Tax=Brevundimonas sp. TaxID=1871086 RepID=UPI00286A52B5|nr:FecR domain-containing protein [Brevundimonas sp.]
MSGPRARVEKAETEAAEWHARLGATRVSPETIEAFFAWRKDPANADAYRRVETVWTDTAGLGRDPEIAQALEAALGRKPVKGRRDRVTAGLWGLAAVGAAAVLAFGGWVWMEGRSVYSTAVGEQRLVQLADGSSVRLDTGSRLRVRFDGDRRLIDLEQGQALFTVAHDTSRPFVVVAGEARVTAVGTVFDVRREAGEVRVTLVSGAVDVAGEAGRGERRMRAGQQARVRDAEVRTTAVDVAAETSWAEGRVVFRDTPLKAAVAEVNRYLTDKIELDAPALEDEAVNGVFETGDREAFVSAAAAGLGLRASAGPDGAVRLSPEK